MKYKLLSQVLILLLLSTFFPLYAGPLLSFYFKPYPLKNDKQLVKKLANKLSNPKTIAKNIYNYPVNSELVSGIFCSYAGDLSVSDYNGQVTFPRRQTKPLFFLVITPKLVPVLMAENTLSHWELEEGTPVKIFKIEKKEDEESKSLFWDVKQAEIPETRIINIRSVIIFAKPKHIYVPEGISITEESPHLLMPDLYVKKGINKLENSLYLLNLKNFFGSIYHIFEREPKRYRNQITFGQ